MKKILLATAVLFLISLVRVGPIKAQDQINQYVCGGDILWVDADGFGHSTFCSAVGIGYGVASNFTGCGFAQQCFIGDTYNGCSSLDLSSCDATTYDTGQCLNGDPDNASIMYASTNCAQIGGCFVSDPSRSGTGVCVPPKEAPPTEQDCSNYIPVNCTGQTYSVCYNNYSDAGITDSNGITDAARYCDCSENIVNDTTGTTKNLCLYIDDASHQAKLDQYAEDTQPWGDSKCPVCPSGYSPDANDKDCRGGSVTAVVQPTSFETCSSSQFCDIGYRTNGGCKDLQGQCREIGGVIQNCDSLGNNLVTYCTANNTQYCCPDSASCTAIGGTEPDCRQISSVGGAALDCFNGVYPGYGEDCNASTYYQEAYYCCKTDAACTALGGKNTTQSYPNGICFTGGQGVGYSSAIGCIPFQLTGFISIISKFAVGFGGGVSLLLLAIASVMYMTSSGNPQKVQESRELFIAAIVGLILIILSGALLKFLGVNVFGLFG